MVKFVPFDKERHAGKAGSPGRYILRCGRRLGPPERLRIADAVPAMPIGFIERGGHYSPVALMGLTKEANVFVGPAGQWLGGYVPAVLRTYPFRLPSAGREQPLYV